MGEMIMRPCGGAWAYCDGDCCHCEMADLMASNRTTMTKTNADHIRSMTDEELVRWCNHTCPPNEKWKSCDGGDLDDLDKCEKCWLDWLKQPYEN